MPEALNPSPLMLHVLIVGGGLCGLATAISVTIAGHKATVFEASDSVHSFGSGLQSSPNGTRLFSRWGLDEILKPVTTTPKVLHIHNFDGMRLARRENFDQDIKKNYGASLSTVHRVDLQAGLLRRARELGARVHYSSRVTGLDTSGPGIQLTNGEIHVGDLVVVADGTWSAMRSEVLEMTINPQRTREIAYRITIERGKVQDKELLALMKVPQMRVWVGHGSYAVGYPVKGARQFCVLLIVADDLHQGGSMPSTIVEELRLRFQNWDPV
jgi:salicylate hydroxylase